MNSLLQRVKEHRFLVLVVTLALVITISPLRQHWHGAQLASRALFDVVLVAGLFALYSSRRWFWIGVVIVIPANFHLGRAMALPDSEFWSSAVAQATSSFAMALFLALVIAFILRDLFSSVVVTTDRLWGAVGVYLMFGVAWGFVYSGLEICDPGSFQIASGLMPPDGGGAESINQSGILFYYSFVTLATLGFGDISPTSQLAQMITMWEAVVGQAYLAILVARLVAMHLSSPKSE